jgi:hypothetical protein
MLIIATIQEAEVEGSPSKFAPDKSKRPYLKNTLKAKELVHGSSSV